MATIYYWRDLIGHGDLFTPYVEQIGRLLRGEHGGLGLEKLRILTATPMYSIRINKETRLLFTTYEGHLCLLDVVLNHDYAKSRFLRDPGVLRAFLKGLSGAPGIAMAAPVVTEDDFSRLDEGEPVVLSVNDSDAPVLVPLNYYQNRVIAFSTVQEGVLSTSLPAVVYGPAGSGKSCVALSLLSQYVRQHHDEPGFFPIVYVSHSDALVAEMSRLWHEMTLGSVDESQVQFKTYQGLMTDSGVASMAHEAVFFEWYAEHKKPVISGGSGGSPSKTLTAEEVLQEFRIRCGYDDERMYIALGERRTGIDVRERSYVCEAYRAFTAHLASSGQVMVSLHAFSGGSLYPLVIVDEAQDLSYGQLQGLYRFSGGSILYLLGEHQVLFDGKSRLPFLKDLLYRETGSEARMIELKTSYRCSERVSAVASALIQLKYRVTGGASDKSESSSVAVASECLGMGEALWLSPCDHSGIALFVEEAKRGALAIVTLRDYVDVMKARFDTPLVFTSAEVKGLEFDTVVVWRPFDDKEAQEASSKIIELSPGSLKRHRAKAGEGDETHLAFFNAVITAVTRARKTVVLVQESSYAIKNIVDGLIPCFTTTAAPRAPMRRDLGSAWADVERQLRAAGDVIRADEIRKDKIRDAVSEVSSAIAVGLDDDKGALFDDEIGIIMALKEGLKLKKDVKIKLSKALRGDGCSGVIDTLVYRLVTTKKCLPLLGYLKDSQALLFKQIPPGLWYQSLNDTGPYPITLMHDLVTTQIGRAILKEVFDTVPPAFWNKKFISIASLDHPNRLWPYLVNTKDGVPMLQELCDRRSKVMIDLFSKSKDITCFGPFDISQALKVMKEDIRLLYDQDACDGFTLPHISAYFGHIDVMYLLNALGADFEKCNSNGITPTFIAAQENHVSVIRFFGALGINLNQGNLTGQTPAHLAAERGHTEVMHALYTYGANLNKFDENEKTPAYVAAYKGHLSIIHLLHDYGVDFNKADNRGCTLTYVAAQQGYPEIISALKSFGVDELDKENHQGDLPVLIAGHHRHFKVLEVCYALGADLSKPNKRGLTLGFLSAFMNQMDVLDFLIANSVNVSYPYVSTHRSLNDFCKGKDLSICRRMRLKIMEMIGRGCDENSLYLLPIEIAIIMGHDAVVERLKALPTDRSHLTSYSLFSHRMVTEDDLEQGCFDKSSRYL